jgi:hypothetical protein
MPLETKVFVMRERIGETPEIVNDVLYTFQHQKGLALKGVQHTMVWCLEPPCAYW